jgi:hypothetical protein
VPGTGLEPVPLSGADFKSEQGVRQAPSGSDRNRETPYI